MLTTTRVTTRSDEAVLIVRTVEGTFKVCASCAAALKRTHMLVALPTFCIDASDCEFTSEGHLR